MLRHKIKCDKVATTQKRWRLTTFVRSSMLIGLGMVLASCGGDSSESKVVNIGEPKDSDLVPFGSFSFPIDEFNFNFGQAHMVAAWESGVVNWDWQTGEALADPVEGNASLDIEWGNEKGRESVISRDDQGAMILTPTWATNNDTFYIERDFTRVGLGEGEEGGSPNVDKMDLTCAAIRYDFYVGEVDDSANVRMYLDDGKLRLSLYARDTNGQYVRIGVPFPLAAISEFIGEDGWVTIEVKDILPKLLYSVEDTNSNDPGWLAAENFDLTNVSLVGLEIAANDKSVEVDGALRFDNFVVTPAVLQTCDRNFAVNGSIASVTFDSESQVNNWEHNFAGDSGTPLAETITTSREANAGPDGDGAMRFDIPWVHAQDDKLGYVYTFSSEGADLTGKSITADLFIPKSYVDNGLMEIKLFIKDSGFNYRNFGTVVAREGSIIGDSWNTIVYHDIAEEADSSKGEFANEDFDITKVTQIGLELVSNGKSITINEPILLDNYLIGEFVEVVEGNFALNLDFKDMPDFDAWSVWVDGETNLEVDDVALSHDLSMEALAIDVDWQEGADKFQVSYDAGAGNITDLTGAVISFNMYIPDVYFGTPMGLQFFIKDSEFTYANFGWRAVDSFTENEWTKVEMLVDEDKTAFGHGKDDVNIEAFRIIGIEFVSNGKSADVGGSILVDDIQIVLPE